MNHHPTKTSHVLVHETKTTYAYDPPRALRAWRWMQQELADTSDAPGYREDPLMTDADRIIYAFELVNGSIFGDAIFSDLADFAQGSQLLEHDDDSD